MRSRASWTSSTSSAGAAGDFRDAPLAEGFHEFVDDAVFEGFLLAGAFQLEHQALAQVARADARRVESLDHLEHCLESSPAAMPVVDASSSTVALR